MDEVEQLREQLAVREAENERLRRENAELKRAVESLAGSLERKASQMAYTYRRAGPIR